MNAKYFEVDFGTGSSADCKVKIAELENTVSCNLLVVENEKFISTSLMTLIHGDIAWKPNYRIGREKFWKVDDKMVENVLWHVNYPRRSEREQAVADRNLEIITKIIDL